MKNTSFFVILILSFFFTNPSFCQIDLENGLIAFYPFNENTEDKSGNNFDANIIDSQGFVSDCLGNPSNALAFDGIDDYLQVPFYDELNFSNSDAFSIALWIKLPSGQTDIDGSNNTVISKWVGGNTQGYAYSMRIFNQTDNRNGKIWVAQYDTFNCGNFPQIISNTSINDEEWHHIVFLKDEQNQLQLYIDSNLEGSIESNVQCDISNNELISFAKRNSDSNLLRMLEGALDNIRFYNRVLTMDEIVFLFNKQMVSTAKLVNDNNLSVFPNPNTNGILTIKNNSNEEINSIKVFNAQGKLVLKTIQIDDIDLSSKSNGMYFLQINLANKQSISKKIVVQNKART